MTIDDARRWTRAEGLIDFATAERWPSYPLRWIVVVGSRATQSDPLSLHVAAIEEGASVRVLATSTELAPRVQFSLLPANYWPGFCECEDGTDGWESVEINAYRGLEFPAHHADLIGVQSSSSEAYAGGGGTFTVLTLLRIDGDRLVPVLEVPSGAYKLIAGDWTPTGREHDEYALSLDLRPDPSQPRRMQLGTSEQGRPLIFEWSESLKAFRCLP